MLLALPSRPALLAVLWLLAAAVAANVEKIVFLAPPITAGESSVAGEVLGFRVPGLDRLRPLGRSQLRTALPAAFAWDADRFPDKSTYWVLLDRLQPGQRYELRVCWAATQPTELTLDGFDLETVEATAALAESLGAFVARRDPEMYADVGHGDEAQAAVDAAAQTSALLVRIVTAADFVASDPALMDPARVPPVLADIILDPFLLNVLPRSLLPTVACIVVVAVVSALLAPRIVARLRAVAADGLSAEALRKKTT